MPELIAQTNMDAQSIQRLREEITKLMMWITKHSGKYFNEPYVPATQEYIDKARGH
jgi:mortality factor 4-like protein 1